MACLPSQPAGVIIVKMSFNIFIPFQYQLTDDDAQQQVLEEQQQLAQVLSRNKISPLFILFWYKLTGDDANVEVQQVLEDQILMGQGPQIATQEFNERFFLP